MTTIRDQKIKILYEVRDARVTAKHNVVVVESARVPRVIFANSRSSEIIKIIYTDT